MRIHIQPYAADFYRGYVNTGHEFYSRDWELKILAVQGTWLAVETKYLFSDQVNTVPVPNVSSIGLRVNLRYVDEIDYENDARLEEVHTKMRSGKIRCHSYRHDTGEFVDLYSGDATP